jgi:K+-sensing histidine kinase KdpD
MVSKDTARHAARHEVVNQKKRSEMRQGMPEAFERILVPVDGSDVAKKTAQKALALAKALDTKVVVMHVINIDLYAYQTELVYPTELSLQELTALFYPR